MRAGVDRGFPQAETFLWRRIMDEKELPPRGQALERLTMQTATHAIYATIIVKRPLID